MTIFLTSMKRILRNKALVAIMLILPLLPIIPIVSDTSGSDRELKIGIADMDKTPLSQSLIQSLDMDCKIIMMQQDEIKKGLASSRVDYGMVIGKGYEDEMIKGESPVLHGYAKEKADVSALVRTYVDSYSDPVKRIALASGKDYFKFHQILKKYNEGSLSVKNVGVKRNKTDSSPIAWGMVVMFMMLSSTYAATQLLTDKDSRTFFRTLSAPVGIVNYMLQSILSYLVVSFLQVTVLVLALVFLFGVYPGLSIVNMYLLFLVFSLVAVSLGVAISSFARSVIAGSVVGVCISLLTSLLGGAWGNIRFSDVLNNVAHLMPTYWQMDGVNKLLDQGTLASIGSNVGILLIFSALFFLLGTWRKADIAK